MTENQVRQAVAFARTFRKIAYRWLTPPPDTRPRQGLEDALYMSALQLSAALAQLQVRDFYDEEA